jgi:3-oxoacyl-[acyl-carrier protein] reductase
MEKVVIVTGASRGIGRQIAKTLAIKNNTVIANYNKSEKEALILKQEVEEEGREIELFKADVSNVEEVKNLVKFVIDKFGRIDVLVNNAGISQFKVFTDITDTDWDEMIRNNLSSVFYMTREVVPFMVREKEGCIINISSIWGQVGASCESHYAVSKAGEDALTKSLAKELGPSNIRVNSIAPGIIQTDMNSRLNEDELKDLKEEIPLEKIGLPEDISKCVEWLMDDNYTTGQVISINGGWNI